MTPEKNDDTNKSMINAEVPPSSKHRRSSGSRRWKFLAAIVLFAIVLVWLAPAIVAHSPMLGWIIRTTTADLDGSVEVGSASLGWFSPIGLSHVEVRDSRGEQVLLIPELQGDRSLVALALNQKQLGTFRLQKPQLDIVLDAQGTNVQRLLAKYLQPSEGESPSVGVEIVDGTVTIEDRSGGNVAAESCHIEKLNLSLKMPGDVADAMTFRATGSLCDDQKKGNFDVELSMPRGAAVVVAETKSKANTAAKSKSNRLIVKTGSLPLQKMIKLAAGFSPDLQAARLELAGRLDCTAECSWPLDGPASDMSVSVDTAIKDLQLSAAALGDDRIQLSELTAVGDFSHIDGRLKVEKAAIDCDLGRLALFGKIDLDASTTGANSAAIGNMSSAAGTDWLGLLAPYAKQSFRLQGNLDIARLAAMLPDTLHIHEQTRVTSGKLELELSSSAGQDGMVWAGRIATSDLTAMRRGRELVWQQPIVVTFNAHESEVGPTIDELKCDSTFLNIKAAGWREDLEASLSFDLDRLVQRLDAFVDLRGTRMAGKGWVNLDWRRDKQNTFELDADLQVSGLTLATDAQRPWSEDRITATVNATGKTDFRDQFSLNTAKLALRLGGDEFRITLARPIAQISSSAVWPLEIDARGQLADWLPRAKSWCEVGELQLAGTYQISVKGSGSSQGVSLESGELSLANLHLVGWGLNVSEPQARLTVDGQYQNADSRMLLKTAQFESPSLMVRGDSLIVGIPQDKPLELSGNVSYQGDLAGLQRWFSGAAQSWQVSGRLDGRGRFKQVADVTSGSLEATIDNMSAVGPTGQKVVEPRVQISAEGVYNNSQRLLSLNKLKFASRAVSADLAGKINTDASPGSATIDGTLNYDMEQLTAILRPYLGLVFVAGKGSQPFSWQGPLNLAGARAQAGFDWSQAYVYGLRFGPGKVDLAMQDGLVRLAPMNLAVGQGQVNLAGQLQVASDPMELHLAPGPLIKQVNLDPEICAYGLKYIAPVLAGVTSAQGQFSIDLDECRIPIDNPATGKVTGRLSVHSVVVGPGPLVRELVAALVPGSSQVQLANESVIAFQMVNSRVYHNGLEMQFPGMKVRTKGSVGLDKTLDLVAEMPVPPQWLRDVRVQAALGGQTITLPIRGTLERPQLDQRRLAEYTREFARQAAQKTIETEIGNQLNRLFGPRK